jgi:hypothetical protein
MKTKLLKQLMDDYANISHKIASYDEKDTIDKKSLVLALEGLKKGIDSLILELDNPELTIKEKQEENYKNMPNKIYIKEEGHYNEYKKVIYSYYHTIYVSYTSGFKIKGFTQNELLNGLANNSMTTLEK